MFSLISSRAVAAGLLAIHLCLWTPTAEAATFAKQCSLLGSRVIDVTYNTATGEYYVNSRTSDFFAGDDVAGGDRFLRSSVSSVYSSKNDLLASLQQSGHAIGMDEMHQMLSSATKQQQQRQQRNQHQRRMEDAGDVDGRYAEGGDEQIDKYQAQELISLHARLCPCAPQDNTYCLAQPHVAQNTCGIPRDAGLPIGCYNLTTKMVFIRNAWPVVVLWYGALLIFLIATENGRSARNWVLGKLFPRRNLMLANQLLRREIFIRDRLRNVRSMGRDEEGGAEQPARTQTLVLKTKRFNAQREREKRRRRRRQQLMASNIVESEVGTAGPSGDGGVTDDNNDVASNDNGSRDYEGRPPMTPERPKPDRSISSVLNSTPETVAIQSPMSFPPYLSTATSSDTFQDNDIPPSMSADTAVSMCGPCNTSPMASMTPMNAPRVDEDDLSSGSEEDFTCSICFMEVEDGEKVGALSCHHIFHVTCLKEWIKRRNVCPLCQEPDIASPRVEEDNPSHEEGNAGESNDQAQGDGTQNGQNVGERRVRGLQPSTSPDRPPQVQRSTIGSIRERLFTVMNEHSAWTSEDDERNLVLSGSAEDASFQRRRRQNRSSSSRRRSYSMRRTNG